MCDKKWYCYGMSLRLESVHWSKGSNHGNPHIDRHPDTCPICLHAIVPSKIHAFVDIDKGGQSNCMQVVFHCPRAKCQQYFIANYGNRSGDWANFTLRDLQPHSRKKRDFSKTIQDISASFCDIYNQAYAAEQDGLLEVCGVGYRKALEFLIKDYLIREKPEDAEKVKKKYLGDCIEKHIQSPQIKNVAKRAVWLGNDETHYTRKWEGKDLNDLKALIDLTLHWFEMEHLTEQITQEMPETE